MSNEKFTNEVQEMEVMMGNNGTFIKVGSIGVGNTGGQNAAHAYATYGIPSVVMNSSERDLSTITNMIPKFVFGSGKGSGKDRDLGREYFLENAMGLIQEEDVVNLIASCDVVSVIFSAGGGQGSSAGPILYNLLREQYPDTVFIIQIVCPANTDMLVGQQHSLDCLSEIMNDTPDATYLVYDNDKYPECNTRELYNRVNSNIAKDLSILRGDYIVTTDLDGIDEEELIGICRVPGRMSIGYIEGFSDYEVMGNVPQTLKNMINKDSAHAVLEDDLIIAASALIYTINEEDSDVVSGVKEDMQAVLGSHIKDYRNEDVVMDGEAVNSVYVILAGLSEPSTRIKSMISRKKELERSVIQSRKTQPSSLLSKETRGNKPSSILDKYKPKAQPTFSANSGNAPAKKTAADILNMYR